jgi:hypothetical protein
MFHVTAVGNFRFLRAVLQKLPSDLYLWTLGGGLILEYMEVAQALPPILQKGDIELNDDGLLKTLRETWKPRVCALEAQLTSLTRQTLSTLKNTCSKYLKDLNRLLCDSSSASSEMDGEWTQDESLKKATEASLDNFLEELMDS